jgi:pentapeptide repeat protein
MFATFAKARQVHELLWYLDEARERAPDPALDEEWARLVDDDLAAPDVEAARERVGELLRQTSERLRTPRGESGVSARRVGRSATVSRASRHGESGISARRAATGDGRSGVDGRPADPRADEGRPRDHSRADLVGVRWRRADLSRASLRGALLLGADLRGADLRLADLLGTDLRGADLRGADLSTSLFVTPMQAAAARGDAATRLPHRISRPAHWLT